MTVKGTDLLGSRCSAHYLGRLTTDNLIPLIKEFENTGDAYNVAQTEMEAARDKPIGDILKELGYPDRGKTGWGGIKPDRDPLGSLGGGTKSGGGLRGGFTGGSE